MILLQPSVKSGPVREILCLGAHCDDIEIGCGGALMRLVEEYPDARFEWVVFSSNSLRKTEAQASFDYFLENASEKNIHVKDFRNGYFPYVAAEIKDYFEELKSDVSPDVIFTHYRNDLHQDHRLLGELTWNTFRDHMILEYEIPKYDGGLGSPNLFMPVSKALANKKVEGLLKCFSSQLYQQQWFTEDTFLGLMRLRGLESNSESGYAEAFYCRKTLL